MVLVLPRNRLWPSGSARIAVIAPRDPPAPPIFSTTTVPSGFCIRSAHWRPTTSFTPPAENGTTSRIGREG